MRLMLFLRRRTSAWLVVAALSALSGCATNRMIDSDVISASALPAGQNLQGAAYRFERLPSQIHDAQAGVAEQHAEAALRAVGMVRDDARARLSVQIGYSQQSFLVDTYGRPLGAGWGPFGHIALGHGVGRHASMGVGMQLRFPPSTHHRHDVSVVLRDLTTGQIVYETRASHTGPWGDSGTLWAPLFQAALAHFPSPPAGPRRVSIDLAPSTLTPVTPATAVPAVLPSSPAPAAPPVR